MTREQRDNSEPMSTADLAYGRAQSPTELSAFPPDSAKVREIESDAAPHDDRPRDAAESQAPLVTPDRGEAFSERWQSVQAEFVDEPQQAVKDADALVAEVIQVLATSFAEQRQGLEEQWSRGSEVSTEDLRQALMQYRSFFQRLLAA